MFENKFIFKRNFFEVIMKRCDKFYFYLGDLNYGCTPEDFGVITKLFSSGFFRKIKGGVEI